MQVVRYRGLAHVRRITADDWKSVGCPEGESVEWSWENGFELPSSMFTTDQIAKGIAPDPHLVLVEVSELRGRLAQKMTPAQAAKAAINPMAVIQTAE